MRECVNLVHDDDYGDDGYDDYNGFDNDHHIDDYIGSYHMISILQTPKGQSLQIPDGRLAKGHHLPGLSARQTRNTPRSQAVFCSRGAGAR